MLRNSLVVIMLFFSSIIYSQSILVSGIVVDEGGNPLPGVTVLIEGTNRGTSSTFEGTYAIKADNENQNIQFSYVGFETQTGFEIPVSGTFEFCENSLSEKRLECPLHSLLQSTQFSLFS